MNKRFAVNAARQLLIGVFGVLGIAGLTYAQPAVPAGSPVGGNVAEDVGERFEGPGQPPETPRWKRERTQSPDTDQQAPTTDQQTSSTTMEQPSSSTTQEMPPVESGMGSPHEAQPEPTPEPNPEMQR